MIFRVIGGSVVYGFALYGVAKFLGRWKGKGVGKSSNKPDDQPGSATAEAMDGRPGEQQVGSGINDIQVGC